MIRTQAELAKIVGYSRVTVSKALAGHPGVLPKTREKILQAAREVGYRPNAAARSMRRGQFGTIGLMIGSQSNQHQRGLAALIRGITCEIHRHELMLAVDLLPTEDVPHDQWPRLLTETVVDGLMLACDGQSQNRVRQHVLELGIPLIWLCSKREFDSIYPDFDQACQLAVQHMTDLGHDRVAFLMPGASGAGKQQHNAPQPRFVDLGVHSDNARRAAVIRELLLSDDRPTGVVVCDEHDLTVTGMVAGSLGMRIPDDLSVVTIGIEDSHVTAYPTDMVCFCAHTLGREAVKLLIKKMNNPHEKFPGQPVAPRLAHTGQSTAAVAAG